MIVLSILEDWLRFDMDGRGQHKYHVHKRVLTDVHQPVGYRMRMRSVGSSWIFQSCRWSDNLSVACKPVAISSRQP